MTDDRLVSDEVAEAIRIRWTDMQTYPLIDKLLRDREARIESENILQEHLAEHVNKVLELEADADRDMHAYNANYRKLSENTTARIAVLREALHRLGNWDEYDADIDKALDHTDEAAEALLAVVEEARHLAPEYSALRKKIERYDKAIG